MALVGELIVDLSVVTTNWQRLAGRANCARESDNESDNESDLKCECAAVVKANAYGLGIQTVAKALYEKGCRTFFVANIVEALELDASLPAQRTIYTLQGFEDGEQVFFAQNNISPVIVSLDMLNKWIVFEHAQKPSCAVKVNTGMNRLGLELNEFKTFVADARKMVSSRIELVLSHLACADEPEHPKNLQQLNCFRSLIHFCSAKGYGRAVVADDQSLKDCAHHTSLQLRFSLANSAGICLGDDYTFDMVRPGIGLYSGTLGRGRVHGLSLSNPVSLYLPVIQVRLIANGDSVGYGASFVAKRDSVIATISGGYADGIFRYLSNRGYCYFEGKKVPIVGRVSMDSFTVDLTDISGAMSFVSVGGGCSPQDTRRVCVFSSVDSLLDLAESCGTIVYELLTSLSGRYKHTYL